MLRLKRKYRQKVSSYLLVVAIALLFIGGILSYDEALLAGRYQTVITILFFSGVTFMLSYVEAL